MMKGRISVIATTCSALVLISGCARTNVSTAINPDASFTRTVKFTGQAAKEGEMAMGTKLEDAFLLPSGHPGKSPRPRKTRTSRSLPRVLLPPVKLSKILSSSPKRRPAAGRS